MSSLYRRSLLLMLPLFFFFLSFVQTSDAGAILVTGATGRTGSLLYALLKQRDIPDQEVRALIRDREKARGVLGCTLCDETEGIYVGDVRNVTTLLPALELVHTVAIVAGASPDDTVDDQKAIEYNGVLNTVQGLAQTKNLKEFGLDNLRVVLCSSMGTTTPPSTDTDRILFYKLNAEAFLGSSGVPSTVVKPCGLWSSDTSPNRTLVVGHDDHLLVNSYTILREDVARVMAAAVIGRSPISLRFDLCAVAGNPTTDVGPLLDEAEWEWQQSSGTDSNVFFFFVKNQAQYLESLSHHS